MPDALTTALGNGLTLEEIQSYLQKGLQLEEIAAASQSLRLRGELRTAGDGPRVPLNLERFTRALEELGITARRNTDHEKPLKGQREVEDILAKAEEQHRRYEWRYATVTDFKAENPALTRYSTNQIGLALDRVGIHQERRRLTGKTMRIRRLPMRRFNDSVLSFDNAD